MADAKLPIIQRYPPCDGNSYEGCCARCGSSVDWTYCDECEEGYVADDFGDDVVPDMRNVPCDFCDGHGGFWQCQSSTAHCKANPLTGRRQIDRGEVEWFLERSDDHRMGE